MTASRDPLSAAPLILLASNDRAQGCVTCRTSVVCSLRLKHREFPDAIIRLRVCPSPRLPPYDHLGSPHHPMTSRRPVILTHRPHRPRLSSPSPLPAARSRRLFPLSHAPRHLSRYALSSLASLFPRSSLYTVRSLASLRRCAPSSDSPDN